jgi:hypothetical protein
MRSPKRLWRSARPLELAFHRCWARLSAGERQDVLEDLRHPPRRQWYIVDEGGVRRLLPGE